MVCSIQAAANVLREGKSVVWVDCFHPVNRERLIDICTAAEAATEGDKDAFAGPLDRLVHFACPSLAHFIALLCRPTESTLPTDTVLIVVDSLSAVINHAFPRTPPTPKGVPKVNNKGGLGLGSTLLLHPLVRPLLIVRTGPPLAARRIQVLQYIVGALQKLAATRDAAVVVLTQCATRMQAERGATLVPAVNTNVWDQGIASRVALYRDWVWADGRTAGARFAAVQKVNGRVVEAEALEKACAFEIESVGLIRGHEKFSCGVLRHADVTGCMQTGIIPRDYDGIKPESAVSYTPMQKRKLGETGFEVPDSEGDDEDYGWGDDDDTALPRPPPQWQGSEDVILGQHPETDEVEGSSIDDTDPGPEAEQAPQDD